MGIVTDKLKVEKYSSYKDSGVEWIGEIPKYWKSERLASILNSVSERSGTDLPLLSITREKGVIIRDLDNEEENHNFIPDDLSNYKVIRKGQFGMNKMKAWQGSYGISDQDGIVSPAYFIFQLRSDIDSRYFHLAIRSRLYVSFLGSASDGVRIGQWDLSRDRMKNIPFLIPPLSEQTAIAEFLDRKTTLIDQAIDIKQKQIELLKERRQILIHKAVTRGLNPSVKMKDSGVEWIGEIPDGWEVRRIKTLTRVKRGASPRPIDDPRYFNDNGEFAWVRIADVSSNDHYLINTVQKLSKLGSSLSVKILPNELFISIAGTVGKPMISKIKCCIHDGFVYFPDLKMNLEYMYRIFETGQPYLGLGKHGTQLNLNTETIGNIYIPLPPANIQNEIVCEVNNISIKFANAISLKEQEIEKLKEYKATLINSAVTGKIKVYNDGK